MIPLTRWALGLVLAVSWLACSKPVPIRIALETSPEPQRLSCPACDCPSCEACPVCPAPAPVEEDATVVPASAEIPAHLRSNEVQCQRACGRLMDVEIRRMETRTGKAKAGLKTALRKGLKEERDLLAAECVTRCQAEFTITTTACLIKYKDLDAINKCILKMTLE
jgi:hypothetical protein